MRHAHAPPAFHLLRKPIGQSVISIAPMPLFGQRDVVSRQPLPHADEPVEKYARQLIDSHQTPEVTIAWHGSESTLMESNSLCEGYKLFFHHIDQPMQLIVRLLR